jgi:short subunit dehydrogenase-like uncharacterized protein
VAERPWLIYGANGYTGRLIAREAVERGLGPVLAGRNHDEVTGLARSLGLQSRVFGLDDPCATADAVRGNALVLHCAGPFSATSQPMIDACLSESCHYLDITGEIAVFADAHQQSDTARRADIVLIPGVGFDVVPTDCLAASLVEALPAAIRLTLAFEGGGGPSPGTAKTGIESLGEGGFVRQDGQLVPVPLAWKSRTIPFAHGERMAATIPWGDVYTAFVSTGVPNIEVYMSMPPAQIANLRRMRWLRPLLGASWMQSLLKNRIEAKVKGPSDDKRGGSRSQLWGEAISADGRAVTASMTAPNGYDLTVSAALGIVQHLLENDVEGGFYTPSLLMGADYASSLPGVEFSLHQAR